MIEVTQEAVSSKARDLFHKGFSAMERGNLDYAIDLLAMSLKVEPGALQTRKFLRAAAIQKAKQKKGGFSQKLSVISGMPQYLKGMAFLKSNRAEDALEIAEELLRKDPLNRKFVIFMAQAASAANVPDIAIQTLEITRDHHPDDIPLINTLGILYMKKGRTKAARECFETLCAICPNDPAALKALKDAMALDSMATDGWEDASKDGGSYKDIIKNSDEAQLLEVESKAVKSDRDLDKLIEETVDKIAAEPENMNYRISLGRLYSQRKMFEEAIEALEVALEQSGGDPQIANTLSSIRAEHFDSEIARFADAGDTETAQQLEQQKQEFLLHDMTDRVSRYPNDLTLRYQYGVTLYEHGNLNEAIREFQLAQKNPKNRVKSFYYLAMCFRDKAQYDMAIEQLEKAVESLGGMDEMKKDIIYQLGQISETMGVHDKAAAYYKEIYQVDIGYRDIAEKVEQVYGN